MDEGHILGKHLLCSGLTSEKLETIKVAGHWFNVWNVRQRIKKNQLLKGEHLVIIVWGCGSLFPPVANQAAHLTRTPALHCFL